VHRFPPTENMMYLSFGLCAQLLFAQAFLLYLWGSSSAGTGAFATAALLLVWTILVYPCTLFACIKAFERGAGRIALPLAAVASAALVVILVIQGLLLESAVHPRTPPYETVRLLVSLVMGSIAAWIVLLHQYHWDRPRYSNRNTQGR